MTFSSLKLRVWNFEFDELDFFPSLNWIFGGTQAVKIQFKLAKKSSLSNLKFQTREYQKSSADRMISQTTQKFDRSQ